VRLRWRFSALEAGQHQAHELHAIGPQLVLRGCARDEVADQTDLGLKTTGCACGNAPQRNATPDPSRASRQARPPR